ncbi:hypothetical protein GALMADRAFT_67694, partial [Galerina marginata CBS 339.88]
FFLSILPAGQPSANALVDLGQQTGTSVTWIANLGPGTGAFLNLRDSTGTLAQSGTFTVQAGSEPLSLRHFQAVTYPPSSQQHLRWSTRRNERWPCWSDPGQPDDPSQPTDHCGVSSKYPVFIQMSHGYLQIWH